MVYLNLTSPSSTTSPLSALAFCRLKITVLTTTTRQIRQFAPMQKAIPRLKFCKTG